MSWEVINRHRELARSKKYDILIWGSSIEYNEIFQIRKSLKDHLQNLGHSTKFSEDLIREGKQRAAPDPIQDELFHADAAQIIIVLYKSRGTQTEFDRILRYNRFLRKSLIFIEDEDWDKIQHSVSVQIWKNCESQIIHISKFKFEEINRKILEHIELQQFRDYVRKLEFDLIAEQN